MYAHSATSQSRHVTWRSAVIESLAEITIGSRLRVRVSKLDPWWANFSLSVFPLEVNEKLEQVREYVTSLSKHFEYVLGYLQATMRVSLANVTVFGQQSYETFVLDVAQYFVLAVCFLDMLTHQSII
jgi:hypothetical protein